jgi:phosphoenolpyruvate phosphomutase
LSASNLPEPSTNHVGRPTPASLGRQLRDQLAGGTPAVLMGAHDGLSARIAVTEGFRALWASGLCMSTALGVRDSDEATWTQLLAVVESMVDAAAAPVLVDGDTGYGNFNTARRFAARAERVGAAGVCLEDKTFPKMNSFVGDAHALAPVPQFCGKIRACKDGQSDPDFVVVARTEAFIAGRSTDEALARGEAYAAAGADALFVHSRRSSAVEIESFMAQWSGRIPVIVAPTTYHATTLTEFRRLGIGGIIWANHTMRAAVSAMRETCREVLAAGGVTGVEGQIASLGEVFTLLRYGELELEDEHYSNFMPPARPAASRTDDQ